MQKQVSKQSLAIIALSILLAICMALTATYAAFAGATKKVTGTITFTAPTLTIQITDKGLAEGHVGTYAGSEANTVEFTFKLLTADIEFVAGGKMQIKADSLADLNNKIKFTINNSDTTKKYNYTTAISGNTSGILGITAKNVTGTASVGETSLDFTTTAIDIADVADSAIVVTITATYVVDSAV